MQATTTCFLCQKPLTSFGTDEQFHPCVAKTNSLLGKISSEQGNPDRIFHEIDNLVFQGGGVKGIAYLGVLQKLKAENEDFFKNLKRVAGSSAGSIVALYIGLNLDHKQIEDLLNLNYFSLLDNGPSLRITTNVGKLLDFWSFVGTPTYATYNAKDVLELGLGKIQSLKDLNKKGKFSDMIKQFVDFFKNVFYYIAIKFAAFGSYNISVKIVDFLLSDSMIEGMMGLLGLKTKEQQEEEAKLKAAEEARRNEVQPLQSNGGLMRAVPLMASSPSEIVGDVDFKALLKSSLGEALQECVKGLEAVEQKEQIKEGRSNLLSNSTPDKRSGDLSSRITAMVKTDKKQPDYWDEMFAYYQNPNKFPTPKGKKEDLTKNNMDAYGFAELLWYLVGSFTGLVDLKEKVGLFNAETIREKLIDGPMKLKFESLQPPIPYKKRLTFKELDAFRDKDGKKIFKPFFATAYNPLSGRTEVFSVYHTPNAIVSDVVKASSSIPGFFTPQPINERNNKGVEVPRSVYYEKLNASGKIEKLSEVVPYMDGGTKDNYPLWIFDDMKYCFEDVPGWSPKVKMPIKNPRSLGFRLLNTRTINIYKKPYYDAEGKQVKRLSEEGFEGSLFSVIKSILVNSTANVENEFFKRGDNTRSAYVDDCGLTAISFNMDGDDKNALIASGVRAVADFKERVKSNFVLERESYFYEDE